VFINFFAFRFCQSQTKCTYELPFVYICLSSNNILYRLRVVAVHYVSVAALVRIVNICFELHRINERGKRDRGKPPPPDGRTAYNTIIYGIWARA